MTDAVFSPRRLRAWRHVRNIDHPTLADAAGTSVEHVHACETGHTTPRSETLTAWEDVLGATRNQLCSRTPDAAGEYWEAASAALPPMTDTEIIEVATLLRRNHQSDHPARRGHDGGVARRRPADSSERHRGRQPAPQPRSAGMIEPDAHHPGATSSW